MRVVTRRWWWAVLAGVLAAPGASAADSTYLQLANVSGPVSGAHYSGWFEVAQHAVTLVPGVYGPDGKTVVSGCTASLRTRLGAAGATVAPLVGASIGDVKLETVTGGSGLPHHQALLRNAVLVQASMAFENGVAYDLLWLRFDVMEVTTYQVRVDGSRGNGTQGYFDCLLVR